MDFFEIFTQLFFGDWSLTDPFVNDLFFHKLPISSVQFLNLHKDVELCGKFNYYLIVAVLFCIWQTILMKTLDFAHLGFDEKT